MQLSPSMFLDPARALRDRALEIKAAINSRPLPVSTVQPSPDNVQPATTAAAATKPPTLKPLNDPVSKPNTTTAQTQGDSNASMDSSQMVALIAFGVIALAAVILVRDGG